MATTTNKENTKSCPDFFWFSQWGTFCTRSHLTRTPFSVVCVCVLARQWLPLIPACVVVIASNSIKGSRLPTTCYSLCSTLSRTKPFWIKFHVYQKQLWFLWVHSNDFCGKWKWCVTFTFEFLIYGKWNILHGISLDHLLRCIKQTICWSILKCRHCAFLSILFSFDIKPIIFYGIFLET